MPIQNVQGTPPLWSLNPLLQEKLIDDPAGYICGADLKEAVNVSLILGQPLLLSGEPGTGKTSLAESVSHHLGLGKVIKFETKSTSVAKDLFYSYDNLARLHATKEIAAAVPAADFISYNALGRAILLANHPESVASVIPSYFQHPGLTRSVVLIDEIDKAPRDFPNDVLNEIEHLYFRIPELANVSVSALQNFRPIVIITSNSERALPDAFLRRCIYYHIPFPDDEGLREIVCTRLTGFRTGSPLLNDAMALFREARDPARRLRKRPGTAEFLAWLMVLRAKGASVSNRMEDIPSWTNVFVSTLFKYQEDQDCAREFANEWRPSVSR